MTDAEKMRWLDIRPGSIKEVCAPGYGSRWAIEVDSQGCLKGKEFMGRVEVTLRGREFVAKVY